MFQIELDQISPNINLDHGYNFKFNESNLFN